MAISVHPFDAPLGAEIRGVDLADVSDADFREIAAAWDRYSVLVFRGLEISEDEHIAFSRRFGELEIHVLDQYLLPEHPEIFIVSNIMRDGKHIGSPDAGRYWHTDLSYAERPSRGSLLYAREVPHDDAGHPLGETRFASTAHAYDTLPDDLKTRVEGLEAEFSLAYRLAKSRQEMGLGAVMTDDQESQVPVVTHKVVSTHPLTGRKCLFVNEGHTVGLRGVPEEEATPLLRALWDHITRPEHVYVHKWRVGDLVMWDNYPTQHLAIGDYALPQRRYMHRTTLKGGTFG